MDKVSFLTGFFAGGFITYFVVLPIANIFVILIKKLISKLRNKNGDLP